MVWRWQIRWLLNMKKIAEATFFRWLLISSLLWVCVVSAASTDPIVVTATMTPTHIEISPNPIPENKPFVIHVINQTGVPVELENLDTSVEIYANVDRTFRVGLGAGNYVFFNDFNTHTQPATLIVKPASELMQKPADNPASLSVQQRRGGEAGVSATQTVTTPKSASSQLNTSEILFIVWRESVEALLVVGVVYAWLSQSKTQRSGFLFLGLGVVSGLLCAVLLSFMLITANHLLSPDAANLFQATMTLIAAGMIVYMVKWMRTHGRTLKANMYQSLDKNIETRWRNISIFTVVAVAVAREASEASIFIYALGFGGTSDSSLKMIGILALGVLLAIATIFLLQLGNKIFSWRFFFKVTEVLLLLLGGGLLLNCIDRLTLSGYLTPVYNQLWDTSFLISDHSFIAPLLSSFMGYRATPSLMDIMIYGAYWIMVYCLLKTKRVNNSYVTQS